MKGHAATTVFIVILSLGTLTFYVKNLATLKLP